MFCITRWEGISPITIFTADTPIPPVNDHLRALVCGYFLGDLDGLSLSWGNSRGSFITRILDLGRRLHNDEHLACP